MIILSYLKDDHVTVYHTLTYDNHKEHGGAFLLTLGTHFSNQFPPSIHTGKEIPTNRVSSWFSRFNFLTAIVAYKEDLSSHDLKASHKTMFHTPHCGSL